MSAAEVLAAVLLAGGCVFFVAGTVGLLRFPDVYGRLHAMTKADNLGMLLVCAGLAVLAGSWRATFLLVLVWVLGMLAASVSAHLIARHARREGGAAGTPSGAPADPPGGAPT
jgi:multicomponent Na+:H+ antiporter subunit G